MWVFWLHVCLCHVYSGCLISWNLSYRLFWAIFWGLEIKPHRLEQSVLWTAEPPLQQPPPTPTGSHTALGWPQSLTVYFFVKDDLEPPVCISLVLRFKACTTTPGSGDLAQGAIHARQSICWLSYIHSSPMILPLHPGLSVRVFLFAW